MIDGNAAHLGTVVDAIRLMDQLVPHIGEAEAIEIREAHATDRVAVRSGETVTFGMAGDGVSGLRDGWAEPEERGSWSVGKRASLGLSLEADGVVPLNAHLTYRPFVHAKHPQLDIVCRARGREIAAWSCIIAAPAGEQRMTIPSDAIAADGALDLELLISDPRSPAELGLSADARLLGIGLERLRLTSKAP